MISSENSLRFTLSEALDSISRFGLNNGFSCAFWREPGNNEVIALLSSTPVRASEISPEKETPGFAFAPFRPDANKLFLPADHLFRISEEEIAELTGGNLLERLDRIESPKAKFHFGPGSLQENPETTFLHFANLCLDQIRSGKLDKVVASRFSNVPLNPKSDPIGLFEKMTIAYPDAFVSLVSSPDCGTWLGATPELLVSLDRGGIFRTVALAGTKRHKEGQTLQEVAWTQKEIEEQALVERYIISCFKKIRVREYDENGPRTVRAGNLLHLRSDFQVDQRDVRYPELATVMLRLLHPTSAVCGTPGQDALNFLLANEGYDRQYYAGYLGPVNILQESKLYVNLRCLRWLDGKAMLFAGAGITRDSIVEQEYQETEMKLDTLRKLL